MKSIREYINLITEAPINIDVRPAQRAAMDTINPANYPDERSYAQAAAAAGNTAGATALQQADTGSTAVATPVAEPAVTATPTPPAPAPKAWNKGVLGMGSQGPEVEALQKRLGITPDGKYGPATRDAVIALQKQLGVTADGAYGPQTKAAHDKTGQGGMPTTAPVASQTAPDQVNQTQQTFNTTQGVAQGRIDPNSARGQATIAQPTTPTPAGNPSGVGKNATYTADEIAAAKEALKNPQISARDKAFYTSIASQQPPAPAAPTSVMARPTNPMQANIWDRDYGKTHNPDGTPKAVKESAYGELERLVSLIHYR